ncbi:hypothetical protein MHM95_09630 [Pseudoalteromonas sp. CnMc7-15]|uniref:AbiJ-NTD4 domain-containing protein n=1 Tax=unclassified Pseudoalteromonas TaxID=194690 RepID=UPI001EF71F45|nr:hypothetical protein [Pseudoalteromonas sp. CnMc7-15]MCG7566550.1 hypothetical protein [Pseudoalteromonas sp. CnMc7-15]
MSFSERNGLTKTQLVQKESIDENLRVDLWNAIYLSFWGQFSSGNSVSDSTGLANVTLSNMDKLSQKAFAFFKIPINQRPNNWTKCLNFIEAEFNKLDWNRVYDFVELLLPYQFNDADSFADLVNKALETNNAAYRVIDGRVTSVVSEHEIQEVEKILGSHSPLAGGAQEHIRMALKKLSDREAPDYRNSIKESISAVESIAKKLAPGEKTLGSALNTIGRREGLHPALKNGFSSIYGYTNDEAGIRHALEDSSNVGEAEARLMFIMCAAFCNYLIYTAPPATS